MSAPSRLTVLYDAGCGFCQRCKIWLEEQPAYLELEFLPMTGPVAAARYPELVPLVSAGEFVVVDDRGYYYLGTRARILCLYALRRYRGWARRLARPGWYGLADRVFEWVSRNRYKLLPPPVVAPRLPASPTILRRECRGPCPS